MNRRTFISSSLAAGSVLASGVPVAAQATSLSVTASEPKVKPPLELALVKQFVVAGHGNLARVKEMLAAEPMFINAQWDWGAGDVETAIGGAAHVGNRELALRLLDAGSRFDAYCAGMLDEANLVTSMLRLHPTLADVPGPHGYTLLYHVGYTGNVSLAEAVAPCLPAAARGHHFNQALQSTVNRGHLDLAAYLLAHGVDNPNTKNGRGKTPLDVAMDKGHEPIARLLREHGAVTSG